MEQVFGYIIGLGAAVMMPIIFTILGGVNFNPVYCVIIRH